MLAVTEDQLAYGTEIVALLRARGIRTVSDFGRDKLGAKIRNQRLMRMPYIAVVGAKEVETRSVTPRSQAKGDLPAMPLEAFVDLVAEEAKLPRIQRARLSLRLFRGESQRRQRPPRQHSARLRGDQERMRTENY